MQWHAYHNANSKYIVIILYKYLQYMHIVMSWQLTGAQVSAQPNMISNNHFKVIKQKQFLVLVGAIFCFDLCSLAAKIHEANVPSKLVMHYLTILCSKSHHWIGGHQDHRMSYPFEGARKIRTIQWTNWFKKFGNSTSTQPSLESWFLDVLGCLKLHAEEIVP